MNNELGLAIAKQFAALSHSKRLQVGATLVTANGVILAGVNGLPKPLGNVLETSEGITKQEVIHAEENALLKAAREGVSTLGSVLYVTHSPCRHCASMLISAGISKVVVGEIYRDKSGIDLLNQANIPVEIIKE